MFGVTSFPFLVAYDFMALFPCCKHLEMIPTHAFDERHDHSPDWGTLTIMAGLARPLFNVVMDLYCR
jgi:hypothetical protein